MRRLRSVLVLWKHASQAAKAVCFWGSSGSRVRTVASSAPSTVVYGERSGLGAMMAPTFRSCLGQPSSRRPMLGIPEALSTVE